MMAPDSNSAGGRSSPCEKRASRRFGAPAGGSNESRSTFLCLLMVNEEPNLAAVAGLGGASSDWSSEARDSNFLRLPRPSLRPESWEAREEEERRRTSSPAASNRWKKSPVSRSARPSHSDSLRSGEAAGGASPGGSEMERWKRPRPSTPLPSTGSSPQWSMMVTRAKYCDSSLVEASPESPHSLDKEAQGGGVPEVQGGAIVEEVGGVEV